MILLTHPGTQYSYQLAKQLVRHQKLAEFWTGFALAENSWCAKALQTFVPNSWNRKIANRIVHDVPARFLRTRSLIGLKAVHRLRRSCSPQLVFHAVNGEFQRKIPLSAISEASAVIGFDTASWIIADSTKKFGKPFFLDQSTSHSLSKEPIWEKLDNQFPAWRENYEPRNPFVLEAERQEHQLATRIVVASSYTKRTLLSEGIPEEKVVVNPYGVDVSKFRPSATARLNSRLRFLFLGSVSALKGVPLLLEAWRKLASNDSELWLVGPISERSRTLIPELPGLKLLGKHPHKELPELLRQCDVLAFPSYSDGFGLVLLEALASGLPVITTEATAGPDLIRDGVEGFIIPSGNLKKLCHALSFFIDNLDRLPEMSAAARRCAERFTWNAYGDRWNKLLEEYV